MFDEVKQRIRNQMIFVSVQSLKTEDFMFVVIYIKRASVINIGIKYDFPCMNICQGLEGS